MEGPQEAASSSSDLGAGLASPAVEETLDVLKRGSLSSPTDDGP